MKHPVQLLLILLLFATVTHAQTETKDITFTSKETGPCPDEMNTFYQKYISEHLKYPKDAKRKGITGRVFIEFEIDSSGEIKKDQVRIIKGIYPSCDEEALRLIKQSPKFTNVSPAYLNKTFHIAVTFSKKNRHQRS